MTGQKMRATTTIVLAIVCMMLTSRSVRADQPAFELKDGDVVALIGDTFAEREQHFSYLETRLLTRWPGRKITFRNLGWSGDTVGGTARSYEKPAAEGFERLNALVHELKPTVIFISYGMGESFESDAKLAAFKQGYERLLDTLADLHARTVLIGPIAHENLGPPLPDPSAHNAALASYSKTIADIAQQRDVRFIDLFQITSSHAASADARLTDNGIHPNQLGYWQLTGAIEHALGLPGRGWTIALDQTRVLAETGVAQCEVTGNTNQLDITITPTLLASPPAPVDGKTAIAEVDRRVLKIANLPVGRYELRAGDTIIASGTNAEWSAGVDIRDDPAPTSADALRSLAVEKNIQYFNQWRPANEPYIFGFRKQEQSRNRVEIPRFDQPIEHLEAKMADLARPNPIRYELKPQ